MSKELQEALNQQVTNELYAAHLYLSMAAYFESLNLPGFANFMKVQHREELSHAMKIFDFINDRNGRVYLQAIKQPPVEFQSVQEVMEKALEHEKHVTEVIYKLYEMAQRQKDYAAHVLMEWFVEEQVEEEKLFTELLEHVKLVGNDGTGLLMLDARLAQRKDEEEGEEAES